jgi:hypothetical protein
MRNIQDKTLIGGWWVDVAAFRASMGEPDGPKSCQLWRGNGWHVQGYGMMNVWPDTPIGKTSRNKTMMCAHRLGYMIHTGQRLGRKDWVLHTCSNPACVNPDHLVLGDARMREDFRVANGLPDKKYSRRRDAVPQPNRKYRYSVEQMVYAHYHTPRHIVTRFGITRGQAVCLRKRSSGKNAYPWFLRLLPLYDQQGNLL